MHAWATAYSLTWFHTLVIQVGELTHFRSLHNFRSLRWVKRQETVLFGSGKRSKEARHSSVQCSAVQYLLALHPQTAMPNQPQHNAGMAQLSVG